MLDPAWASKEKIGNFGFSGVSTISLRDPLEAGRCISEVGEGRFAHSLAGESG